jgi:AcrR family transcriptional regulator
VERHFSYTVRVDSYTVLPTRTVCEFLYADPVAETHDPIAGSVWRRGTRLPDDAASTRRGLTREQIVAGAIALLDAEGADGLSMRKLGTRLGSGTTSAYWHVANKDELLDLALDEVLGEVTLPQDHPEDWRAAVADYVRGVRRVMLEHTWISAVIGRRPNVGPHSIDLSERMLSMLESVGFGLVDAARAASSLTAYAIGNALSEAAWRDAQQASGMSMDELSASFGAFYESESDARPVFARWWREAQPLDIEAEREVSFEFGLDCLLDGLAARLPA